MPAAPRARTHTCHEDVARLGHAPALPQQLEQVPELPVDVAADRHGARDGLDVRLLHERRAHALAEELHVRLREVLAVQQLLDPGVGVEAGHVACGRAPSRRAAVARCRDRKTQRLRKMNEPDKDVKSL